MAYQAAPIEKIKRIRCRNLRDVERIVRWLNLDCDYNGCFDSPKYWGHKTYTYGRLFFHIYRKNA